MRLDSKSAQPTSNWKYLRQISRKWHAKVLSVVDSSTLRNKITAGFSTTFIICLSPIHYVFIIKFVTKHFKWNIEWCNIYCWITQITATNRSKSVTNLLFKFSFESFDFVCISERNWFCFLCLPFLQPTKRKDVFSPKDILCFYLRYDLSNGIK